MEFSSILIDYLYEINQDPMLVTIWATFGVPLFMGVLAIPFGLLRKIGLKKASAIYGFITLVLMFTWLIGFVTQIAFLFLGFPGIKMLLLWVIMLAVCTIFVSLNYSYIKKWIDKHSQSKN